VEDIDYKKGNDCLLLFLPTKNKGKFRWKNRHDNSKFGSVFATREIPFKEQSYLEWQIGYDSTIEHKTKTTILSNMVFIGANGKEKNPYELAEILFLLMELKLISIQNIKNLKKEIEETNFSFEDSFTIKTSIKENIDISGFNFYQHNIILPTFSDFADDRSISIEISIKQQQYASGTQPMVYLVIPINNFKNGNEMLGLTSNEIDKAIFSINYENKQLVLNLFKYFGICSVRHKSDVITILDLIIEKFK
jgi:hypothetical protein